MDSGDFDSISWGNDGDVHAAAPGPGSSGRPADGAPSSGARHGKQRAATFEPQAGRDADPIDTAGIGDGRIECTVEGPQKEQDGTKDAFVSYRVTTKTDFPSFQTPTVCVRRRFTDFVFLYKTLSRDYPATAVPPLPEKHKMEYVRGDRFGPDFTNRRAHSLHRFLKRLTLHPVLRRAALLIIFLESADWNAHMRLRPQRALSASDPGGAGAGGVGGPHHNGNATVFDNLTDTFLNAFSKVHKPDRRFIEVREKADRLDDDLGQVEKIMGRVARREAELEADYGDLAAQFRKLLHLEPGLEPPLHAFAAGVERTSAGVRQLREHTDQNYVGSLRDMEAYLGALRALLKTREQKQLDFEALTDYLAKAAAERDTLASSSSSAHASTSAASAASASAAAAAASSASAGSSTASGHPHAHAHAHHHHHPSPQSAAAALLSGPGTFLRSKMEDVRGVDHEQARRERVRKLELRIDDLTREVESAKKTTEAFDDEVVRELADMHRIRAVEFRDTLGALADAHLDFYRAVAETWRAFVVENEDGDGSGGGGGKEGEGEGEGGGGTVRG